MARATKKQVLGRGLTSILKDSKNKSTSISNVTNKVSSEVDISKISLNPFQPRSSFDREKLDELVISIKNIGLIQPITIKKNSKNNFQLISGERRLRAFKELKITKIPCYIRKANDQQSLEMALVENIHRQDLDSIEIAISYKRLIEEINLTQEELSKKIGKKRSTITNYLRLLKLNPIIQSGIKDGFITMGHGRAMINIDDEKTQLTIYEKIISKNLSVRNTEKLIQSLKNPNKNQKKEILKNDLDFIKEKAKLEKKLEAKVDFLFNKDKSGRIKINFKSKDDFLKILNKINE
jgi:ParB family chromosome partitioning protein|tara:strand:- start:1215 stop:2096 length:882 start_codon:yes stop_codon:yes gene_type:complete